MNFQIHNLDNGRVNTCDLSNLSRSLMVNCEIIVIDADRVEAIGFVNHHLLTFFATEFADYALKNYVKNPTKEAKDCISLLRKWLDNPSSVSNEELMDAAHAAAVYAAAANAAYTAYAAAANAASAAAHAVVYIACYAGNNSTSNPVAYAADACADAAGKNKEEEFIRQGKFILDFFSSNDKIEA